jgi:hypothetical protein
MRGRTHWVDYLGDRPFRPIVADDQVRDAMKRRSIRPQHNEASRPDRGLAYKGQAAFDLWLERGLHQMYDRVAEEPLPEALLRLIEEDRRK